LFLPIAGNRLIKVNKHKIYEITLAQARLKGTLNEQSEKFKKLWVSDKIRFSVKNEEKFFRLLISLCKNNDNEDIQRAIKR